MLKQSPTEVCAPLVPTARVVQQAGTPKDLSVMNYRNTHNPPASYEKLTVPLFVARYSSSLPVVIRVCRGFCGPTEDSSISEGDRFNIHFVKHTTVVTVECENGTRYNVPLNSAIPFGIMYDPHNDLNEALRGYRFDKISDLIQASPLPRVVRARKGHVGSTPENSLVANELLLLRKVTKKLMGKKELRVFSLTSGMEKVLGESVRGEFSTKPREVCLYLPELLKHVQDLFPHKAVLYGMTGSTAGASSIQAKLSASIVKLMHSSIETSLVATSANGLGLENSRLVSIPVELDILVCIVSTEETESRKKLHDDTRYIYSHFDPSQVNHYVKNATNSAHDTQSLLYTTIRCGHDAKGVELIKPTSVASLNQSPPALRARSRSMDEESSETSYNHFHRQHSSPIAMAGSVHQRPLPPTPFGCSPPVSSPLSASPLSSTSPPSSLPRAPAMEAIHEEPPQTSTVTPRRQRTPGYSYVDAFPMRCTVKGSGASTDGSGDSQICLRELDETVDFIQQQISSMDMTDDRTADDGLDSSCIYDVPSSRPAHGSTCTSTQVSDEKPLKECEGSLPELPSSLEDSCEMEPKRSAEDMHETRSIMEKNRQHLRTLNCLQVSLLHTDMHVALHMCIIECVDSGFALVMYMYMYRSPPLCIWSEICSHKYATASNVCLKHWLCLI